jgi:hypothetical protein
MNSSLSSTIQTASGQTPSSAATTTTANDAYVKEWLDGRKKECPHCRLPHPSSLSCADAKKQHKPTSVLAGSGPKKAVSSRNAARKLQLEARALDDEAAKQKAAQEQKELDQQIAKHTKNLKLQANQWAAQFAQFADITSDKEVRVNTAINIDDLSDGFEQMKDTFMQPVIFASTEPKVKDKVLAFHSYVRKNYRLTITQLVEDARNIFDIVTTPNCVARVQVLPEHITGEAHLARAAFPDLAGAQTFEELDRQIDLWTADADSKRSYLAKRMELTLDPRNSYVPLLRPVSLTTARTASLSDIHSVFNVAACLVAFAVGRLPITLSSEQVEIDLNLTANLVGSAVATNFDLQTAMARIESASRSLTHVLPHHGSELHNDLIFQSKCVAAIVVASQCTGRSADGLKLMSNLVAGQNTSTASQLVRMDSLRESCQKTLLSSVRRHP